VPLFAITNFSGEFWRAWVRSTPRLFDRFRDVVVSGDEKLVKPDPAIYALALKRFGLKAPTRCSSTTAPPMSRRERAMGIHGVLFTTAEDFRAELVRLGLLANCVTPASCRGPAPHAALISLSQARHPLDPGTRPADKER
jgi:2-haloacid dehalogenase